MMYRAPSFPRARASSHSALGRFVLAGPREAVGLAVILISCFVALPRSLADRPKANEYQVKAAYLSNFAKFVRWSPVAAASQPTFNVCVLGQDPFGPALDAAVAGETVDNLPLEAKRITAPVEAGACRILYIGPSENDQLKTVLATVEKTSALTVSDIPKFTKQGGMIEFVLDGNRVRFEVNLTAAQHAGLNLSSDLLKLAVAVQRGPE